MFVVDTNLFIYAVHKESKYHQKARRLIQDWQKRALPWHSTWSIFYEFLRVVTHPAVFAAPLNAKQAASFLESLMESPGFSLLSPTEKHRFYWKQALEATSHIRGNLWHDAHIVVLMQEHGITEIQTADADFHRFEGIKVKNPLKIKS